MFSLVAAIFGLLGADFALDVSYLVLAYILGILTAVAYACIASWWHERKEEYAHRLKLQGLTIVLNCSDSLRVC